MSQANQTEIELLNEYLDLYRRVVAWKLDGLTLEEAAQPLVPSGTSLLGLVKHLAFVERYWFQIVIQGSDIDRGYDRSEPDADYRIEPGETIASVLALYERECATSRTIISTFDVLDSVELLDRPGNTTIRDILVHMVEESARHAGHMDILRELTDGATGDFPEEP